MSATTSGAIKAHLESAGLGISVYRDLAPQGAALPFAVVTEGISQVPDRDGDLGDQEAKHTWREEVQVSLFQTWRTPDGKPGEDYTLVGRLLEALDGCRLRTAPTTVYGVRVNGRVRLAAVDAPGGADGSDGANVVHDAITATVRRNLT
jgi:hypothetical protein